LVKGKDARWENRRHFFAAASESMRRILIERARRHKRLRHGGHMQRIPFDDATIKDQERSDRLVALDECLTRFEVHHPRKAQVVKLRFFVGMSIEETAEILDISLATVKEDWRFARAWLSRKIEPDKPRGQNDDR
jgi:RNA polymerase sigma factor (TIGR02999 family)